MDRSSTVESSLPPKGNSSCPIGEATSLANQSVSNPQPTPSSAQAAGGGEPPTVDGVRVVQFSILYDGDEEKFEHLWAMRDCMHRALNTAISEWHRSEKVVSKKNPDKMTRNRAPVTEAVKGLLERERAYWVGQLPKALAAVETLREKLGRAKAKAKAKIEEDGRVQELELAFANAQKFCLRARVRGSIGVPSAVSDSVVQFTMAKHGQYAKAAFRGDRSLDSFRSGQPIRWRDGAWEFRPGAKKGMYELALAIHTDGKRIRRGVFQVLPEGPAMYGFAKQMVSGEAKLCDARVVYSEKNKQWFAKLAIRTDSTPNWVRACQSAPKPWTKVATLRRGVNHAFVLIFEGDEGKSPWVEYISGGDVLHFKRKLKARKEAISKHGDKLELGPAARGRGKRRRFAALRRVDDGEARFIDCRCKTWGVGIAKMCAQRGVSKLLVSTMKLGEFRDGNDNMQALLYQWPFAKMRDQVAAACKKIGVEVRDYESAFNARRCPKCKEIRYPDARPVGVFVCEPCKIERPVDQIVAWNGLTDVLGPDGFEKAESPLRKFHAAAREIRPFTVAT